MPDTFDLARTYLNLDGNRAGEIDGTTFWQLPEREIERLASGWLVATFALDQDTHWECHPAGDEVLNVVSGSMKLIQQREDGEHAIEMVAGDTAINPHGTWHRLSPNTPTRLLAMTYGKGTEHRPV